MFMIKERSPSIWHKKTSFIFMLINFLTLSYHSSNANTIHNITERNQNTLFNEIVNVTKSSKNNSQEITLIEIKATAKEKINKTYTYEVLVNKTKDNYNNTKEELNPKVTYESIHQTEGISLKPDNATINCYNSIQTAARRSNTFINPSNINDPNFQKLLDQYRGMVHKYNGPPNPYQQVQELQPMSNGFNPPLNNPYSQRIGLNLQNMQSRLTTQYFYSTTPSGFYQGVSQPALIKGHYPKWGGKIGRDDIVADPSLLIARTTTAQRTKGALPGQGPKQPPTIGQGGHPPTVGNKLQKRDPFMVTRLRKRTTPPRVSFEENCDYIAFYCLKAYETGKVCGRTMFNTYTTFTNYCLLDFVNCMERYEVWQIAHMGECFELQLLDEYIHYPYMDDHFLDQYYIVET